MLKMTAKVSRLDRGLPNGFNTARSLSKVTVNNSNIDVSLKKLKVFEPL